MESDEAKLAVANTALKFWIEAVTTGSWENYLGLLTEDYTFWLPEGGSVTMGLNLKDSKEQLVRTDFNNKRLKAYNTSPSRISVGENTVVYEFLFDANEENDKGEYYQNCMALSFDLDGRKVSACREYHCVLMNF